MKIIIESKPLASMRYATLGDWYYMGEGESTTLHIDVAETNHPFYNRVIAVHELVEAILTDMSNVFEGSVTDFDVNHPEDDDPGDNPKAPYRAEHCAAMAVDRILFAMADESWREYEEVLEKIWNGK